MLLISRRRRPAGARRDGKGPDDPGRDRGLGAPEPAPANPAAPWRRWRVDRRGAVVLFGAAVTVATIPPLLLDPGGPVGVGASFGAQLLLVPMGGLLWWRWRGRQDRVLTFLIVSLAAGWTVSSLAMLLTVELPGPQPLLDLTTAVASPLANLCGLGVMVRLCHGRGHRLGLIRIGQGIGLLVLLGASAWVLQLGSGEVITALPAGMRAVALGYLANYLVGLSLAWYALFRRRRVGVPGLGLLCLAQALGAGVTALIAVRSLPGGYVLGSPIELGWVLAAELGLAAAASRRVLSPSWERKRQRIALVGVLLLAAGSMAFGVARFMDRAADGLQARHQQGERLRAAVDRVHMMYSLSQDRGDRFGNAGGDTAREYRVMLRTHASVVRTNLRAVSDLARRQGATRAELARLGRLGVELDRYTAMLQDSPMGAPTAQTVEQGERLLVGLWEAGRDSDRRQDDALDAMQRVAGLLQLAVPLGLLIAGLTFVSSWTTLARRERDLEEEAARRKLTKAIVHAQERERGRIAADLHDGPLQQVAAWRIKVELVLRKLDRDPPQARELLASLDREVAQQAVELRRLMHALRPPILDELGLEAAVGVLARDAAARAGVEITLDAGLNGLRCTPEVETLAYRIVQEGLTNVAKHAAATEAVVSLTASDGGLLVRIADNGRGMREFEPDQLVKDGHFGLAGIDERVEIGGGRLDLMSVGGQGTTLLAWLPASLGTPEEHHEE
jgi:signal transduction histidine kinase